MAKSIQPQFSSASAASCLESKTEACAPDAFHLFIRHERARVNREGGGFGLVLWALGDRSADDRFCRLVIRSIKETMRTVDLLGLTDASTIGVLLPGTSLAGARIFADHANAAIARRSSPPPHAVHAYPESWDESVKPSWEEGGSPWGSERGPGDATSLFASIFPKPLPPWKRAIDIAGSLFGLIVLAPLFTLIALCIVTVSPGKVFFRQMRIGRGGAPFLFMKFRTMHEGSDAGVHREHLKDLIKGVKPMNKLDEARDRRIIRGGGFLRATSLDELPQLLNVLRGEMSLVGPRPCIPYEAKEYLRWHSDRFDILPGMTGLWQVSGKNSLSFEEMIRLDIAYTRRITIRRDVAILLRTPTTVAGLAIKALASRLRRAVPAPASTDLEEGGLSHV
jgi:lipopolysaccharide/colanic/teichoic acid biosynthesis glycosyltransferase